MGITILHTTLCQTYSRDMPPEYAFTKTNKLQPGLSLSKESTMKVLSLILAVLLTTTAFTKESTNAHILKAIKISLQQNDLKCVNEIYNSTLSASKLNLGIYAENAEVDVTNGEQPLVIMTKTDAKTSGNKTEKITTLTNPRSYIYPENFLLLQSYPKTLPFSGR